ncbi:MAG: transporter, permease protein [Polyangiaceae bacterium]|jgi:lipoprotein-releasing system permease protein|nr:transporter, permease protein [Polyangiaceae bacterium]
MGFPLDLALRYMGSKKRAFISVGTMFATLGVALGVGALATVMSVTGGFRAQFREKVLGVNAHVLVLKYATDFREYRQVMEKMKTVPGVTGVAPFVINPMMITHRDRTATGVLLKGVDPAKVKDVLDLPRHVVEGSLDGLRLTDAKPPERRRKGLIDDDALGQTTSGLGSDADSGDPLPPPAASSDPPLPRGSALKQIEDIVKQEALAAPDASARVAVDEGSPGAASPAEPTSEELALPEGAPVGNIVPEGGYQGELPEDDALPADALKDPCKDPTAVKKLPGIVIGVTLKRNLEVNIGDCLQVTSPTIGFSYSRGSMRAPVAKQFRVTAVFDAGFDQYDSKLVYTDLYEAQAFYDTGDSVTGVEMKVADIEQAKDVARTIDKLLANGVYHTLDWEELNHGLFTALQIQQLLMSFVLALIIVVAAFTVIATLIMVVLDKKKEIAVIKAMGASDSAVLRSFVYQGGFIGLFGTAFGLLLGIIVCKLLLVYALPLDPKVYFISHLPVQVRPLQFVMVGVFAILVCLAATIWPALYASRLRPAEAFRDQ